MVANSRTEYLPNRRVFSRTISRTHNFPSNLEHVCRLNLSAIAIAQTLRMKIVISVGSSCRSIPFPHKNQHSGLLISLPLSSAYLGRGSDPGRPVAAVLAAGPLHEAGLQPDVLVDQLLDAEVSAVVLQPAVPVQPVPLLTPVSANGGQV